MFFSTDNHVTLKGNLAKEVTPNFGKDGKAALTFVLYCPTPFLDQEKQVPVVVYCHLYGKQAENLSQYAVKGSPIAITGFLKNDNWTDDKGKTQYRTVIQVDQFKVLENKETTAKRERENLF